MFSMYCSCVRLNTVAISQKYNTFAIIITTSLFLVTLAIGFF